MATHVLEAVIVASIMLTACVYVSTFEGPPPNESMIEDGIYGPKAEDFLKVMDDAPATHCGTNSRLEGLVVDGARGNHTEFNWLIRGFFDPGVATELLLDNLNHVMHLHGDNIMGLTRDMPIFPRWGQPETVQAAAATGSGPVAVQVPSEKNSELIRLKGEAARTSLQVEDGLGTKRYVAWSPTALLPFDGREGAANLSWLTQGGRLEVAHVETPTEAGKVAAGEVIFVYLNISGSSGGPSQQLPPHTGVEIAFPQGWSVEPGAYVGFTPEIHNETTGARLVLRLNDSWMGGNTVSIPVHPPANPTHPFDIIRASLFNGSFGQSTLVFQYATGAAPDLARAVYPTTPYPVKPNTWAFFGASFVNGGPNTTVKQVDIEIPGGYDIWANDGQGAQIFDPDQNPAIVSSTDGHDAEGGLWRVIDGRHAQWTGNVNVSASSAAWFGTYLPITAWHNQTTSIEPPVGVGPEVRVGLPNGAVVSSTHWGESPGIIEVDVPNETIDAAATAEHPLDPPAWNHDGYQTSSSPSPFNVTVIGTDNQHGYQYSNGTFDSDVTDAATMDSAAANSTFSVRDRLVRTGDYVVADADFSSVLSQLSANGVTTSNLTVDLYAPPSLGCAPTSSWTMDTKSLPRPRVGALKLMSFTGTAGSDVVAGLADQNVYRLDASGNAVINAPGTSTASAIAKWADGALDEAILVGDDSGNLSRIDPSSGAVTWSTCVAVVCDASLTSSPVNVTRILPQPDASSIATVTLDGRLAVVDPTTGHILRSTDLNAEPHDLIAAPSGGYFVATSDGLRLLDASLAAGASAPGKFFAVTLEPSSSPQFVRAIQATDLVDYDLGTLSWRDTLWHYQDHGGAFAVTGATGDIDGDGWPELAFGTGAGDVYAANGASGELGLYDQGPVQGTNDKNVASILGNMPEHCYVGGDGVGSFCASTHKEGESTAVTALAVGPEGVAVTLERDPNVWTVALLDEGAHAKWAASSLDTRSATTLDVGTWGTHDSVVVGFDDGSIEGFDAGAGTSSLTVSPSDVAGTFTLHLPTPAGGFYGSNLLVASLNWLDSTSHAQSVRLVDWFDSVDDHGRVVTNPTYRVVLAVKPYETRNDAASG